MKDQFYHQLNQSHKNLNQKQYIKDTTKIIGATLTKDQTYENLLIIGAGNLSDFDLDFLSSTFNQVYLSDIDDQSIYQALEKLKDHQNMIVKQVDYIGMRKTGFFNDFVNLLNMKSHKEINTMINTKIIQLLNYNFSTYINITFDAIYISPIYTQLLYREVESKLTSLSTQGLQQIIKDDILSILLEKMSDIIHHFNLEVIKLLKNNGVLFVSSDIFYLTDNLFSEQVKKHISDQKKMDEIYQTYQHTYGIGLGDYGLLDISSNLCFISKKWLLWGITENNAYAVQFYVLKKTGVNA